MNEMRTDRDPSDPGVSNTECERCYWDGLWCEAQDEIEAATKLVASRLDCAPPRDLNK